MSYILDGYKIMGQEAVSWASRNKAKIGTGVSIVGTLVSNILSTRAGAKSARQIDAKAAEIGRALTTKEKVQLCWKNHILSGATAATSMVGAAYSDNQHVKNFNKLATTYGVARRGYESLKQATKEVLGEKKNAELQAKLNQKTVEENPELQKKLANVPENPNPGIMQLWLEPIAGEVFYQTRDNIEMSLEVMRSEMAALPPRVRNKTDLVHGVLLRRFYDLNKHDIPAEKMNSKFMKTYGFNKGYHHNQIDDDDDIGAYFTPIEVNGGQQTAFCINWNTDPTDMTYGNYEKS